MLVVQDGYKIEGERNSAIPLKPTDKLVKIPADADSGMKALFKLPNGAIDAPMFEQRCKLAGLDKAKYKNPLDSILQCNPRAATKKKLANYHTWLLNMIGEIEEDHTGATHKLLSAPASGRTPNDILVIALKLFLFSSKSKLGTHTSDEYQAAFAFDTSKDLIDPLHRFLFNFFHLYKVGNKYQGVEEDDLPPPILTAKVDDHSLEAILSAL